MIVFLLIVIIAILLFGAGAVLGVAGIIVGGVVGLLLLFFTMDQVGISGDQLMLGVLAALVLLFFFSVSQSRESQPSQLPKPPSQPAEPELPQHVRDAIELNKRLSEEYHEKIRRMREEREKGR